MYHPHALVARSHDHLTNQLPAHLLWPHPLSPWGFVEGTKIIATAIPNTTCQYRPPLVTMVTCLSCYKSIIVKRSLLFNGKKVDQITLVYHFCFLLLSKKGFAYILGSLSQPHSQASVCGSPGMRLHSAIPQNEGLICALWILIHFSWKFLNTRLNCAIYPVVLVNWQISLMIPTTAMLNVPGNKRCPEKLIINYFERTLANQVIVYTFSSVANRKEV